MQGIRRQDRIVTTGILFDFRGRTSSIEDATNDKYADSVGENYEGLGPPSRRSSTLLVTVHSFSAQDSIHQRQ